MERRLHMVAIGNDGGRMFDSVRYRMYATEDDVILDGTMARIKLEYRAGDIAYGVDLPQPFDMGLVEDEAMKFDPGKPVGMPPVWLIVCGEATPQNRVACPHLDRHRIGQGRLAGERACCRRDRVSE